MPDTVTTLLSVPAHVSRPHLAGLERLVEETSGIGNVCVSDVYGSLPESLLGHARAAARVPRATIAALRDYVGGLHQLGLSFHYTVNAPWSGGIERTGAGRQQVRTELDRLLDAGIDGLILANPYVLRLAREWYPDLRLIASVNLRVRSVCGAQRVLALGADRVVLDREVNRDAPLLRAFGETVADRFVLLANSTCLMECPYQHYHALESGLLSLPARASGLSGGAAVPIDDPDACFDYCLDRYLRDPVEHLRSPWIRPEDLGRYVELGARRVKIQGRGLPPAEQLSLVRAYLTMTTPDGRLAELFPGFQEALERRRASTEATASRFGLCDLSMGELEATGFFSFFFDGGQGCAHGCSNCQHCLRTLGALSAHGSSARPAP